MKKSTIAFALLGIFSLPTYANDNDKPNWLFTTGIAQVAPNDDSGSILGGGVGVDSSTGLGFSLTRMLDDNWGLEVLAALPFSHNIHGNGVLSGLDVGETKQLPPTISVIYQWGNDTKYHVGLGLNYTKFFEEKSSSALNIALDAETKLKLDSSTGYAVKLGFDSPINDGWNFHGSIRYIAIDTTANIIIDDAVAASVDVDIDPLVLMLGVSFSF